MAKKSFVDYQLRGAQFKIGDVVYPFLGGSPDMNGKVVAVWPAIGMVDVEWPHGSERLPVEDIQRISPDAFYQPPDVSPGDSSVPGGADSVPVSVGPSVNRVTSAYVKKALYWASKDRRYRARQSELGSGKYICPKCGEGVLRKAIYKRREGQSLHLLGCPHCLFLIKQSDIIGDPSYTDQEIV